MSGEPAPRFDPNRRRAVTLSLLLVSALASFESTGVSTAMPTIIGELGGLPLYAWVFSVYLLTSTIAMPVYGRLADIYGRRRLLLFAIAPDKNTPIAERSSRRVLIRRDRLRLCAVDAAVDRRPGAPGSGSRGARS